MFETIVLRRSEKGEPISFGRLAEMMLYYQKAHLILDVGTLWCLIDHIGAKNLLTLLKRPELSAVYCEETLATMTNKVGVSECYSYLGFTFAAESDGIVLKKPIDRLIRQLIRCGLSIREARRFAAEFFQLVPMRTLTGDHFHREGVTIAAQSDLLDVEYANKALAQVVSSIPGGYPVSDVEFEVIKSDLGIFVFSSIDFNRINSARSSISPAMDSVNMAHLLGAILDARADLSMASFYGGDFVTSSVTSCLIQMKQEEILRRTNLNTGLSGDFQEIVLDEMPALGHVIDSGQRTFDEFLNLLDQAHRFKKWLGSVTPDQNLVGEYFREVNSLDWFNRLPGRSTRFVLSTLVGMVASPLASLAAGAADAFLLEKLLAGWRPSHFVTRRLGPFLGGG